ncbi:MAG: ComF family protein [Bacteroidetes bacterium]|nr:MAG: ComF family protein [Bacteroidota bacterium]
MQNDFLSLVFPKICYACGKSLFKKEDCICTYCHYHLPRTNFHLKADNPVHKLFWGRVNIHSASAMYLFNKESKVQHLIHQLKYRGKKEIGISLGRYYGRELKKSLLFSSADMVIPVPLHLKKLKKRGYNQSEVFVQGLAESLKVVNGSDLLIRTYASQTQTQKSRFDRWKNVEEIFKVTAPEKIAGKHILLADDVVTTGSTLEACANKILEVPGTKVSVVTIASTLY